MRLFLVRHGETDWLGEGRLQGNSPISLNTQGRRQAREVADFFRLRKPGPLFSSFLPRAQETASYISEACSIPVQSDERLNEINFGEWEGKTHDEIKKEYPALYGSWSELKENFQAPGGEEVSKVCQRVLAFFNEVRHLREGMIAVSHGGPIRLLILVLLEMPFRFFRSIRIDPASITFFEEDAPEVRIGQIDLKTGYASILQKDKLISYKSMR
jgi:broad specificity phosphatase PhoE